MPTPNGRPSVQDMVIDDLTVRLKVGIARYGTPLQPHNGRDALRDAYEEALDLACYLRQAIAERDEPQVKIKQDDLYDAGHGHVRRRPDGLVARCGGPGICPQCGREAASMRVSTTAT